jgi:tetratricopeptide (TPR) repeat protein
MRSTVLVVAGLLQIVPVLGKVEPPPAVPAEDPRGAAIALYDQGRYQEAGVALKALDDAGKADGSLLYRLAYCVGVTSGDEARSKVLERSVAALEKETQAGGAMEAWFYLSNAYQNLGRIADSTRVAAAATARFEPEKSEQPKDGLDLFRLAKLYADQGKADRSSQTYRKAIDALTPDAARYPTYLRWARRYLAEAAMNHSQWDAAAEEYAAIVALPAVTPVDWNRLAVARIRLGRWQDAADAWHQMELLVPGGVDDARYSRQLALQAAAAGTIPLLTPDGRTWDKPTQEELEKLLVEQAQVATGSRPSEPDGSAASPAAPAPPVDLAARLKVAHAIFLAAGLEYAARGLPIRETAFTSGFAPLVFHPEQWEPPTSEK